MLVDGLLNKKDELLSRVDDLKPTIIALTEIKAKNAKSFVEEEYYILNYDMFLNSNHKRGVALYVDSKLNACECEELNRSSFEESVWCTFTSANNERVLLGCIYRSPNTSDEGNDEKLFQLLKSEEVTKFDKICITGDFNYPNVRWDGIWSGLKNYEIIEKVQDAFLIQKVKEPTRRREGQKPTLDDWILVNDNDLVSEICYLDPLGKSDHNILSYNLSVSMKKIKQETKYVYDLNKGDYTRLRDVIRTYDWSVLEHKEVEEAWVYLKEAIQAGIDECIPKKRKADHKKFKPVWMNSKTLKIIKKKYNLYRRYLHTKSGQDYLKYVKARNKCTKVLKITRKEYEKQIANECKNNPKKFWKYVQDRMKTSQGISSLKQADGSLAVDDVTKAETLNDFFSSVFTQENINDIPKLSEGEFSSGVFLGEVRVTPLAVKDKLKELDPKKAQGPDKIASKVLKELCEEISGPLCLLYNKSLEEGTLPKEWKSAEVTALFKKGSKSDPGNYRPVSLTCVTCKVLESLVRDVIVSYFTDNKLFVDCQHGFRKRRSCVTQLLEVMEDLTALIDLGKDVDIVYCDFRKAFDSVPHNRLLLKLAAYGIRGNVLKWISSFLFERKQWVKVGSERSKEARVLSGIPQGSILGPILFTIYINDLPELLESTVKIFADDTKIYNITSNSNVIQEDLNKLQEWCERWKLYLNVQKCKVLHVGKRNSQCEYAMKIKDEIYKLNISNSEKDLGVTFDCSLTFDAHIQRVVSKANQMIGVVKRAFTFLDKETFLKLYKAFVRPHVEYANVIWSPYLKRQSIAIEKIQRRATKILSECRDMTYGDRLRFLRLHSLKGRRIRGDLIQTFKILNEIEDVNTNTFFAFDQSNRTRNFKGKIFIKYCRTNRRKFSFAHRVANNWNSLPTNIKFAPSVNSFKNHIDTDPKFQELFYEYD